jgi:hypothetical protein
VPSAAASVLPDERKATERTYMPYNVGVWRAHPGYACVRTPGYVCTYSSTPVPGLAAARGFPGRLLMCTQG